LGVKHVTTNIGFINFLSFSDNFLWLVRWSAGPLNNRAGNPPDNVNCTACHSSFQVNSGNGSLFLTELLEYAPGDTYDLEITLEDEGQVRWGFELAVLDEDNDQAGDIVITDNTNTQTSTAGGVEFLKQTSNGTYRNQEEATWEFRWIAPAQETGDITFYIAGNAANGNNNNQGDYIYTFSATAEELPPPPEPDIVLSDTTHDFGVVFVDSMLSWEFTIENASTVDLMIDSITSSDDVFLVEDFDDLIIEPDGDETVSITFSPNDEIEFTDDITIYSNDPDESEIIIAVSGTGFMEYPPDEFSLLSPADGSEHEPDLMLFQWEEALDANPGDTVMYMVIVSTDSLFNPVETIEYNADINTELEIEITDPDRWWWKTYAYNPRRDGTYSSKIWSINVVETGVTSGDIASGIPQRFEITEAYPNPFNPEVNITLAIPLQTRITAEIYNMIGQKVSTLVDKEVTPGFHNVNWKADGAAGVFFLKVRSESGWSATRKLTYMK